MDELDKYYDKRKGVYILPDGTQIEANRSTYKAPLGDLVEDFIYHIKTPWWRRKKGHDELTQMYKDWLNEIVIEKDV